MLHARDRSRAPAILQPPPPKDQTFVGNDFEVHPTGGVVEIGIDHHLLTSHAAKSGIYLDGLNGSGHSGVVKPVEVFQLCLSRENDIARCLQDAGKSDTSFTACLGHHAPFVLSGFSFVATDIVVKCSALPRVQLTRWVIRGEHPPT